ncbi:hypothetical protein SLE2022_331380 [Rubroshorea leprosula]
MKFFSPPLQNVHSILPDSMVKREDLKCSKGTEHSLPRMTEVKEPVAYWDVALHSSKKPVVHGYGDASVMMQMQCMADSLSFGGP